MEFTTEGKYLLLIYEPFYGYDEVEKKISTDGYNLKNTFFLDSSCLYESQETDIPDDAFCFKIGEIAKGYYHLSNDVFGVTHNFYISETIKLRKQMFITNNNISIIRKIDEVVSSDVYISDGDEYFPEMFPYKEFQALLKTFPNSTELKKYTHARISHLLLNYFDGVSKYASDYESYLNKRSRAVYPSPEKALSLNLELYLQAQQKLKAMLDDSDAYSEHDWQLAIWDILRILYPKYILAKREQDIGSDGRHKKHPDFLLIDASGFVDLLEIKKPNKQRLITSSTYRDNYVADRDLSGAIVQIEKYIYTLNHGGANIERTLQERLSTELPKGVSIKVTNPQGMLLMGRSHGLTDDQLFDLEVIKRQHKNIVDIMTYDDLLFRLDNIIEQLS